MRLIPAIRNTAIALLLIVLALFGVIYAAMNLAAQDSIENPCGKFDWQNVRLAPWSDLAYIKVIDIQAPASSFHTQMYDQQSLTQKQRNAWLQNPVPPEDWREYVQLQDAFAGNDTELPA